MLLETFLIVLMAFAVGYIGRIAYIQLRDLYRLYKFGKELDTRWSDEVLEVLTGEDKDERD